MKNPVTGVFFDEKYSVGKRETPCSGYVRRPACVRRAWVACITIVVEAELKCCFVYRVRDGQVIIRADNDRFKRSTEGELTGGRPRGRGSRGSARRGVIKGRLARSSISS